MGEDPSASGSVNTGAPATTPQLPPTEAAPVGPPQEVALDGGAETTTDKGDASTANSGRENRPKSEARQLSNARRRHWYRVGLLFILVAGPGLFGWLNRPRVQEAPAVVGPSVAVLASQPGIAATVNATLSVGFAHGGRWSKLVLTLVATSATSGPVRLAVGLNDFPRGTVVTGARIVRVSAPAAGSFAASLPLAAVTPEDKYYGDYAVGTTLSQPQGSPLPLATITILAPKPIGEGSQGAQLRVAFPVLRDEGPGASPQASYQVGDLFRGAPSSLLASGQGHPVALQAGTSSFSARGVDLSGYQVLAGDAPTLLATTSWTWDGINDATVLAANVHADDNEQHALFYSGIALGLAAGALVMLLIELIAAEPGTGSAENKTPGSRPTGDKGRGQPGPSTPAG